MTQSCYVAQAGLELMILPQSLKSYAYRQLANLIQSSPLVSIPQVPVSHKLVTQDCSMVGLNPHPGLPGSHVHIVPDANGLILALRAS